MAADAPTDHRERELKFDVPADWTLPDLDRALGDGVTAERVDVQQVATYFDTPGRDLFACQVTLRRRSTVGEGSRDSRWTMKIPDGDARIEINETRAGARVPASLNAISLGLRGGAALVPLATLRTSRAIHRLTRSGVVLVELVVDDVQSEVIGEPASRQSWREVEVEIVDGAEKDLQCVAKWLVKHGAAPASSGSKLARALGAARGRRDPSTMAGLIGSYLDQQVEAIVRGDTELRRRRDAIHPTRVATRRYRSVLRVFAKAFDTGRAAALDEELKWFAAALGEVRDRQVLREHLADSVRRLPDALRAAAAVRVDRAIEAELAQAQDSLDTVMRSPRYFALVRDVRAWRDELPGITDAPAVAAARYVKRAERAVAKRLDNADRASHSDRDAALHRVRKAAKRARYVAEVAEPAMGKDAARVAKRAQKTQRDLGNRQDAVLAIEFLMRIGAADDGFVLGVLYERERARVQK